MKKSLRVKFKILIISLISINLVFASLSVYYLLYLKKSITDFSNNNFQKINPLKNMLDISQEQNLCLFNYIWTKDEKYRNDYFNLKNDFYNDYNLLSKPSYEPGEKELIEKSKSIYTDFIASGEIILNPSDNNNSSLNFNEFYNETQNSYTDLKNTLNSIYELNDIALKNKISDTQEKIIYYSEFLVGSCFILLILSLFLSDRYLNKLLLPLIKLQQTIRELKVGNFYLNDQIHAEDEIGEIYKEFQNMSRRIMEFKDSTLGQLMEEKNKSLSIVKSISNPLIVLDNNFRCILINNASEQFFNLSESSLIGRHILEFITNGELFDFISKAKEEKFTVASKVMSFNQNSNIFNVSLSVIKGRDSALNGIIVYFQDITEFKKLEKLKQDFISTLSHELKTPLTSIMMGASMLEENTIIENINERHRIIAAIQEDADNLLNMINKFLRLSEFETDQNYLNFEISDVAEIVKNSIKKFSTITFAKNIQIVFKKSGNLPMAKVDKEKLSWVFNNLISNAIKYSSDGKEILINLFADKNYITITVEDYGMGIEESDIEKIFDKFYKCNDFSDGTGLGLPLSKQIVELHNGTISCSSLYGRGSTFTVTLPIIGG
ncbi:MAG: ATP-binding protein [Clostridiaceae bacterium]